MNVADQIVSEVASSSRQFSDACLDRSLHHTSPPHTPHSLYDLPKLLPLTELSRPPTNVGNLSKPPLLSWATTIKDCGATLSKFGSKGVLHCNEISPRAQSPASWWNWPCPLSPSRQYSKTLDTPVTLYGPWAVTLQDFCSKFILSTSHPSSLLHHPATPRDL